MLPALGDQLVSGGAARRTRYALRRPLRGVAGDLPLYAVDEAGQARHVGDLALLRPEGSLLTPSPGDPADATPDWPLPDEARDGWWGGLPYPLYDMRPQGYLGRQFARAEHAALGLPALKVPLPNPCSNEVYEQRMTEACARMKAQGIEAQFVRGLRVTCDKTIAGTRNSSKGMLTNPLLKFFSCKCLVKCTALSKHTNNQPNQQRPH